MQYLHYRLNPQYNRNYKNHRYWFCHTIKQWQKIFPFWSEDTITRTIKSLKGNGLIAIEQLHKNKNNHTNWYSLNYDSLQTIIPESSSEQRYLAPKDKKIYFNTQLADSLGLKKAIILQHLHFWIVHNSKEGTYAGNTQIFQSYSGWKKKLSFYES